MPIQLRPKARAETVRPRKREEISAVDWLGLWGLSVGFCAVVLASVAGFVGHDNVGASCILIGAASIMTLVVYAGAGPGDRG
jgi:hypothetical protein